MTRSKYEGHDEISTEANQLDLFAEAGWPPAISLGSPPVFSVEADPATLNDTALLEAVTNAKIKSCAPLVAEVVARRLPGSIHALEDLCRRFTGFGRVRPVKEQVIALDALAIIGGRQAAGAVIRLVSERVVEGPGLRNALIAANALGARLPADILSDALDAPDPALREAACRCSSFWPQMITRLRALLDDLHVEVATAAAIVIGNMGNRDAAPHLTRLVETRATEEIVKALAAVANEDEIVLLGRLAESRLDLRNAVCQTLEEMDHPKAMTVLRRLNWAPESTQT